MTVRRKTKMHKSLQSLRKRNVNDFCDDVLRMTLETTTATTTAATKEKRYKSLQSSKKRNVFCTRLRNGESVKRGAIRCEVRPSRSRYNCYTGWHNVIGMSLHCFTGLPASARCTNTRIGKETHAQLSNRALSHTIAFAALSYLNTM